jgi:exonuclease VII small subunit
MSVEARLDEARDKLRDAREVARKRDAHEEELLEAVREMRETIADKRAHRQELDEVEDESQRERIADKIEELEADLDVAVDRLDRVQRRSKAANEELRKHKQRVERLRKRRREIKENSAGQLTADFHVAEFGCRDGTPVPASAIPALKRLCQEHLQPLRNSGGVVSITSGYRTRSYNASIGGASMSYHIYDERPAAPAADHVQAGRSASAVQQWHDAHNPPDGMGYYSGFTHIDDRGYRSRWYGAG